MPLRSNIQSIRFKYPALEDPGPTLGVVVPNNRNRGCGDFVDEQDCSCCPGAPESGVIKQLLTIYGCTCFIETSHRKKFLSKINDYG